MYFKVDGHMLAARNNKLGDRPFNKEIAKPLYKQYKGIDYESMNQYHSFQKHVFIVIHGREFKCSHSTAIRIFIDKLPVAPNAKTIPLSCRRKPGRPKQALGCYQVQDYVFNQPNQEPMNEDEGSWLG